MKNQRRCKKKMCATVPLTNRNRSPRLSRDHNHYHPFSSKQTGGIFLWQERVTSSTPLLSRPAFPRRRPRRRLTHSLNTFPPHARAESAAPFPASAASISASAGLARAATHARTRRSTFRPRRTFGSRRERICATRSTRRAARRRRPPVDKLLQRCGETAPGYGAFFVWGDR